MNLLFVAYSIVESEGGSLSLAELTQRVNASKKFRIPGNKSISVEDLRHLIQEHGRNIQVTMDDKVETIFVNVKPLSGLFKKLVELFQTNSNNAEIIAITLMFYERVAVASHSYETGRVNLASMKYFLNETDNDSKISLIAGLKQLDRLGNFDGKLRNPIQYLESVNPRTLKRAFNYILDFDISEKELTAHEFAWQFEDLFINIERFSRGIFYIPEFIREVISKLVMARPFHKLYNPVLGIGEMFTSIHALIPTPSEVTYIGSNAYDDIGCIGAMNLILHQIHSFDISSSYPLTDRNIISNSVDCIICQPPFGGQSSIDEWQSNSHFMRFGTSRKLEVLYLQLAIDLINENGRAFIVLPEGIMSSGNTTESAIRKYLVENDFIDSVISFPSGTYRETGIKTNILYIDKNKPTDRKGKILFYDAFSVWVTLIDKALITSVAHLTADQILESSDHEMVRQNVPNSVVLANDSKLSVSIYVNSYARILRKSIEENEKIVKIQDILSEVKLQTFNGHIKLPYFKGGDLSKDPANPYLVVPTVNNQTNQVSGKIVEQSAVLVSRIGGALNPTIFKYDNLPIVVNQNIYVFPINSALVDLEYFALELSSELVKEQLKAIITGSTMQYYNYSDLLNIQIRLPEISEQRKRLLIFQEQVIASKRRETQLLAEKMLGQEDEIKILSAMKHSFGQLPFKSDLSNIESYINNRIEINQVVSWSDPISPAFNARTVGNVFGNLMKMIDDTNELFQNMENLIHCDPAKLELKFTKLHDFIKEVISKIELAKDIKIFFSGKNISARIDQYQFKELIRNFVYNAHRHGFKGSDGPKVMLFSTDYTKGGWYLKIYNNGNPFPSEFTLEEFTSFGKRQTASDGSGIGGYLINKVVKNHNGIIYITENPTKLFPALDVQGTVESSAPILSMTGVEFNLEFELSKE